MQLQAFGCPRHAVDSARQSHPLARSNQLRSTRHLRSQRPPPAPSRRQTFSIPLPLVSLSPKFLLERKYHPPVLAPFPTSTPFPSGFPPFDITAPFAV